ncbi:carbonate dehydratase [Streptococcus equinus]|uniref:carbonate dehydratase n=1 Tax=Streptococcus equinus TaxID=1335 RepID=UPI003BF883E7
MMTYITEIAFYDSIFSVTLELAKVSNTLLKTIKNRVRLVENELKTWGDSFSKLFRMSSNVEQFYKRLFMRAMQKHFSDLGEDKAVLSITCCKKN